MKLTTRKLAAAAMTAAAYAALTMLLAPISYGPVQCRVSEALCVLPALMPCTAWGLFIGCAAANLISSAGLLDVVFGSLATLGAGLCAAVIGKRGTLRPLPWGRCALVCLMPAVWNGPIIGGVIAWATVPADIFWESAALFGAQVAAGELVAVFALGLPLLRLLPRSKPLAELIDKTLTE